MIDQPIQPDTRAVRLDLYLGHAPAGSSMIRDRSIEISPPFLYAPHELP